MTLFAILLAAAAAAGPAPSPTPVGQANSCLGCHADPDSQEEDVVEIPKHFRDDVHAEVGLSCPDCHGGNPEADPDDADAAMDEAFLANPYRGAPSRKEIPKFCGRCHSDPVMMKRYAPAARVDQEAEYATSRHGKALAKGDTKVAVCIDCHGVHGIARVNDKRSPVHPTRVAETCSHCHSDEKRMAGRKRDDGSPLPTNQFVLWKDSVHAKAMFEHEDLSAPTCNDCHGNHGAAPPGVDSVAFVCGQCHGREADFFRKSPKHASLTALGRGGEQCTVCHGNHAVLRPTVAMLSPLPETPCAFCHEGALEAPPEAAKVKRHYEEVRDGLLARAESDKLFGDPRFNRLVEDAKSLPFHQDDSGELRPEFDRLFTKFRIGPTMVVTSGGTRAVVQCGSCHDGDAGATVASGLLHDMREVTGLSARAERTLLAAQRGGIEVGPALLDVGIAVDAQIELEASVHTFSLDSAGATAVAHERGFAAATRAQEAGLAGLAELRWRRSALVVALALVSIVLIALALKIRALPDPT